MKMKTQWSKTFGMQLKLLKVYCNTSLLQEARKISNYLTLYLKELEKEQQMKPKASRIEIIKIRKEKNDVETKKKKKIKNKKPTEQINGIKR